MLVELEKPENGLGHFFPSFSLSNKVFMLMLYLQYSLFCPVLDGTTMYSKPELTTKQKKKKRKK